MSKIVETYTTKEAIIITENIKKLCSNTDTINEKLIELFEYPNQDKNLRKLDNVLYMIKNLQINTFKLGSSTYSLKDSLMYDSIMILLEYEYFNSKIDNKSKYDIEKLKEQYEKISQFILNKEEVKLHFPKHPNHLYKNELAHFLFIYKLKKEDAYSILDELLDEDTNKQITKKYKHGILKKINQYKNEIKNDTLTKNDIKTIKKKIANLNKLFS